MSLTLTYCKKDNVKFEIWTKRAKVGPALGWQISMNTDSGVMYRAAKEGCNGLGEEDLLLGSLKRFCWF
jgi:hypothetical protein